jgi:hypothetical protein
MSSDTAYDAMLERLLDPGAEPAAMPSTAELVEQLAGSDPQLAMVAKLLARREAALTQAAQEAEVIDVVPAPARPPVPPPAVDLRSELLPLLDQAYAELGVLRHRNDALAAALGACYLCWGEDPGCPTCDGRGTPGWVSLDPHAYRRLIAPAVRTLPRPAEPQTRKPARRTGRGPATGKAQPQ